MRAIVLLSFVVLAARAAVGAPFAYVSGCRLGTCSQVTIVDTAGDTVVGQIPITGPPGEDFPTRAIAVNATGTRAYVTSFYGNGLAVIDTATNTQIALVPTLGDGGFEGVAISPDGTRVWVADDYGGIATIDATTNTLLGVTNPGYIVYDIVAHPSGAKLYVSTASPAGVLVLDSAALTQQAFVPGSYTRGLAMGPNGASVYAADGTRVLPILYTDTLYGLPIPVSAFTLAFHPDGTRLYAADSVGSVTVINVAFNSATATLPVIPNPWGITAHPDGTRVYVTSMDSAGMAVLDTATNTVTGTVPIGTASSSVAVVPTPEADLKCYKSKAPRGVPRLAPLVANVVDGYETKSTSVTRAVDFCTPVTGTGSVVNHRTCYAAADVKGQFRFNPTSVVTTDRFGTHVLRVLQTATLCLSTTGSTVDDVKCHKARAYPANSFTPRTIAVTDDYETKNVEVLKPVFSCEVASVDGGPVRTPWALRTCYKVRDAKGQTPFAKRDIGMSDAFGSFTLTLTKPDLLCVPTSGP